MELFMQGLAGMADAFIHPQYVSAVYPVEAPSTSAIVVLIIGFSLFAITVHLFERWRMKRKENGPPGTEPPGR